MTTYRLNEEKHGIEITFAKKPAEAIRAELKANGFRWGRGYWYAKQTPDRIELAKRLAECQAAPEKVEQDETKNAAGTPQNRIKIYYNGFKLDGDSKLTVKVYYRKRNDGSICVTVRNYNSLPRDLFDVENDSDIYTDYFCEDSAEVAANHPLYKYLAFAAYQQEKKNIEKSIAHHEKMAEKRAGRMREWYKNCAQEYRDKLEKLEEVADPGQPTAEDLAKIDTARQEAENEKRQKEHDAELARREAVMKERHDGFEFINRIATLYPIECDAPTVLIPFSENPAFYSFMVEDEKRIIIHEDGTKTEEITKIMPRCVLSVTAAEIILNHYDTNRAAKNLAEGRGGYDKTDFIITWTDESGEPWRYEGRYDLGDGDGGLIAHIRALAEWDRTHDKYGHETDTPQEVSESRFAWVELLERYNKPLRLLV